MLRNRKVSETFTVDHVRCLLDQCDADQWPDFSCAIIDFLLQLCMPYGKLLGRLQDVVLPQLLDFAHQQSEGLRPDREEWQGEMQASTKTFISSFHAKLISTLAVPLGGELKHHTFEFAFLTSCRHYISDS